MRILAAILLAVAFAPAHIAGVSQAQPSPPAGTVKLGVDVLLDSPSILPGRRIGLVTHAAGITSTGEATAAVLLRDSRFAVTALFAPEHGIDGTVPAGQSVPGAGGPVPTFSLYGATRQPTPEMMANIDVFVVDLQDVGARAYTYVSTMAMVMESARATGKPVVVLDRPNPQGGVLIDGPVLDPAYRSFIGMFPISMVHGMTIGELAQLFNAEFGIGADLTIVPMRGWTRRTVWEHTGLPWVRPSPNIPTMRTPLYYSATGVLDGTNLGNGIGTPYPFEVVLAPWLDGAALSQRLNALALPGVSFEPYAFVRNGTTLGGVRLLIGDPLRFRASVTALHMIVEIRNQHPQHFQFVERSGRQIFDFVWGTDVVRKDVARGAPAGAIAARWEPELRRFDVQRAPYLIYPQR
jgi:uncharacterized protein YbbC (DUF1343 family)